MIWRLTEILNQKAVDWMSNNLHEPTEYEILQLIGEMNFVEVSTYSEDIVLCVAQPFDANNIYVA